MPDSTLIPQPPLPLLAAAHAMAIMSYEAFMQRLQAAPGYTHTIGRAFVECTRNMLRAVGGDELNGIPDMVDFLCEDAGACFASTAEHIPGGPEMAAFVVELLAAMAPAAASPDAAQPNMAADHTLAQWFYKIDEPRLVVSKTYREGPSFLLASDINDKGAKRFAALSTPPRGPLPDGHFYEIAMAIRRRKFLLDIEWLKSEHPELEVEPTLRTLRDAVEAVHGTGALRVAILCASRGDKVSFHVIFSDTCLGFNAQEAFVAMLKERVAPFNFPKGVPDWSIYDRSHAMRMLGQTKLGGDRPLVPYGEGASTDAYDYLWCHYGKLADLPDYTWHDQRPAPEPAPVIIPRVIVKDSPERRALIAKYVRMLSDERAHNEPTWFEVHGALYNIGYDLGEPDAFKDLFVEFSRRSPKYNIAECEAKWAKAKPGGFNLKNLTDWAVEDDPVAGADVKRALGRLWHADREEAEAEAEPVNLESFAAAFRALGFEARVEARVQAPAELPPAPVMEAPAAVIAPMPTIPAIPIDVWTWKPSGRETYEEVKEKFEKYNFMITQHGTFGRYNFDSRIPTFNSAATLKTIYSDWRSKDDGKSNFITKWMKDIDKRRYQTVDFAPPPCTVPDQVFNTFYGFKASLLTCEPAIDMGVIEEFIDILAGREASAKKYLLDWMASCVQRPAQKSDATAVLLHSTVQGVGKNMLIEFLGRDIIGTNYYKKPRSIADTVFGRFADALENTVLLFLDETKGLQKYAEDLKGLITDDEVTIERKGMMPMTFRNAVRLIMATNNDHTIKVEATDRRYVLINCSAEKVGNGAYFTSVRQWMNEERNQRGFYDYLMTRDISKVDFINGRPMTDIYKQAKLDSLPPLTKWLVEKVNVIADDAEPMSIVIASRERDNFRDWARLNGDREVLSDSMITRHLKKLGVVAEDHTKIDNVRAYQYVWADIRTKISEVTRIGVDLLFAA